MKNIYAHILDQDLVGLPLVLATVTKTSGSTPQKPGSSALFNKGGLLSGTVGGGIIEGKVMEIAASSLVSKESSLVHFNLSNDISNTSEPICGGQISILIDPNTHNYLSVFKQIRELMLIRKPGVLITMVTKLTSNSVLINRYLMTETIRPAIPGNFLGTLEPVVLNMLSSPNKASYAELKLLIPDEEPSPLFFLEPIIPLPRLVIAGAGHIGKALAHLGNMLSFEVVVIDDRAEYANYENIPDADRVVVNDIGEAMTELEKNDDTYVVIVTRGHKDDAAALKPCIGSVLAYTGMIGSKKKVSAMQSDFIKKGWATCEQWERIYTPIGLDINSKSVEEIAVSIAAQLIKIRGSRRNKVNLGSQNNT